jgi:hypothetical protein
MSLLMRLLHLQASVKWIGNIEKKRPPFWCLELNISMLSEWMQQSSSNREKKCIFGGSFVHSYHAGSQTPEEPLWLNSHSSHSANVFDSNTAVTQSSYCSQHLLKNAKTPCCICTFVIKSVFDLGKSQQTSLLCELQLILAKIRPMPELCRLVLGCLGVAVGRADAFQFHEDVQEDVKVLLRLDGKLALPLFRHIKQCACDGANFHGLEIC